ncbi:MAG: hypothetical protein ABI791_13120 [Acidobacteriota bacterium]
MSRETIAKISGFVICLTFAGSAFLGCSDASSHEKSVLDSQDYQKPKIIGRLQNRDIKESSGIAASRCQNGVYWTHNDSGDGPFVFAFDAAGRDLGKWRVVGARNTDWEDIAASKDAGDKCFLYIGEIGNNKLERAEAGIYRVAEPNVNAGPAAPGADTETEAASLLRFRYPDGPHNAESLLVNAQTGNLYVLTKRIDGPAFIFRLQPDFNTTEPVTAEKIGEIAVPSVPNGLLTGAAVADDGRSVIICDYTAGYELKLPAGDANFDDIWKQKPAVVDLGDRKQGESVTYSADGRSILATSEGKSGEIFEIDRRK